MIWHVCGVGATFEDVWRRAWVGCVNVSRQREQERCQYSNINGTGHHGSSRRHCVTSWSDAVCASQAEELFKLLFGVERTLWGAASTTIRQEHSWATCCEIEVMPTFRGSMGQVWGAGMLTLDGGSLMQMLVDMVWRVNWAKSAGGQGKQLRQEAS